ncbi:acetolactate synthase large subunit [Parapusillimonas granuli]|uniref:Acetolactate synthase large subunit n=1 Tax=Parapusillimonas granuli TaxID=380911 RepID=A0A853FWW7_9BURK|nr:acetolactate synthase large subunit [Parapusillimonas granuli]MBB5214509.1 acetolactate synthase-1/2/3 large subunit [Parapusillimonas granuli]MEB2398242.1 acetolactate synthase large subunit [Alcaligenaceae bacterium]NYT49083.1 acetolactate synthase large subunit [Parapusillimonas granuli]
MNGADSLCDTLLANDVDVCFANPGTSEMHFVAALDRKPRMRCVLGLFEGVVTGAADGYARMADKPAATLLHLGPGLGNGLANLHNARRARVPMINIVGDHATYHLQYDAPLTSDIEALAGPMSHWVRRTPDAQSVSADAAEAVRVACRAPGQVATLILPADAAWTDLPSGTPAPVRARVDPPGKTSAESISAAARAIRSGQATVLLLGGAALRGRALAAAGRIAHATGVRLVAETSNRRVERGRTRPPVARLPYPVDLALDSLKDAKHLLLAGSRAPIAFFAYPGKPSKLAPEDCAILTLAAPDQDMDHALEWLADELGIAASAPQLAAPAPSADIPVSGRLTGAAVNMVLASRLPEHAIVCDESITQGREFPVHSAASAPHDWLQLTGGAIGIGLPLATGAAVACPDRKVITLQADGSGMYTVQALWTQARENLDCLTIILANRSYATLYGEMKNVGVADPGRNARRMLDLHEPPIDWVGLSRSLGVEAVRADTVEDFIRCLQAGLARKGPFLIEALI